MGDLVGFMAATHSSLPFTNGLHHTAHDWPCCNTHSCYSGAGGKGRGLQGLGGAEPEPVVAPGQDMM